MGSLVRPLLVPRCSLSLMPIESDPSEDKRQHMNNKNHRAKKNLHHIFVANDLELVKDRAANFSLGWRTDLQREEGGEIPTARLSGNHVQVLCHHSRSTPEPLPCTPLLQPAQETVFTSCQFQKSGSTFLLGGTSSSSRIVSLFLTPVTVSPFNPHL